jgi:hypothetical protein
MLGKRTITTILLLLIAALVLVACGGPADDLTATIDAAKPTEVAAVTAEPTATVTVEPTPTAAATSTTAPTAEATATATTAPTTIPTVGVTVVPVVTQPSRPESLVQRIQFAPGATSQVVSGQVGAGQRDVWLFYALAGQSATISVSSAGNAANFTLSGLTDGLFHKHASDPARQWSGVLPLNQDYIVVITAPALTNYNLSVAIAPLPATGSVRGLVWQDLDRDNIFDANEAVGGAIVRLASPNCAVLVAETTSSQVGGAYAFYNVAAGTYCVLAITPEVTVSTLVQLAAGEDIVDVNLSWPGPVVYGSIRGLTWHDLNNDNELGENEAVSALVRLWGGPQCSLLVSETTSTQVGGAYAFYNLEAGTYCVEASFGSGPVISVLVELAAGQDAVDVNLVWPGTPPG